MLIAALLFLQVTADTARSAPAPRDVPRRTAVSEQHLATAFSSPGARTLLLTAREARLRQDSALLAYDVKVYERVAVGFKVTAAARERPLFAHEDAARVRWRRDVGAVIDVTGARSVHPGDDDPDRGDRTLSPVPYQPGREELMFFGDSRIRREVNEREVVHPLAEGAEAYYTYETGDSTAMRLPNGNLISLRELRVRPREARWNLAVGSLWFDAGTGQLVRAGFRLAVPMDIWEVAEAEDPTARDDIPAAIKPLLEPAEGRLTAIGIEYGLYQGRFWLPRARVAEGSGRMGLARASMKFEQRFTYTSVNAAPDPLDPVPDMPSVAPRVDRDTMTAERRAEYTDSLRTARRARRDSVRAGLRPEEGSCRTGDELRTRTGTHDGVRVLFRIPCSDSALAHSPDLPPSLFESDAETAYTMGELRTLIRESLPMSAQARFDPQPPRLEWGPQLMRYNRVEGFSAGLAATQELGAGYALRAEARLGVADLEPNVELEGSRSNLERTLYLEAYNRLQAAGDWGNPLNFGSSVSALLFGRDEGFYYRTTGAALRGVQARPFGGMNVEWRAFAERHRAARQRTTFSVFGELQPNIDAARGGFAGGEVRLRGTKGINPEALRLFSDLRFEGAASDTAPYGRMALDLTVTRPLGRLAASLTGAAGTSAGELPVQRRWFLGGTHTIRGQEAGAAVGDAFWMGRLEIGTSMVWARPVVFGDIGWAGDRASVTEVGRPLSGAGVGASIMDGLLRVDLAQGIYPEKKLRFDVYLEGRF